MPANKCVIQVNLAACLQCVVNLPVFSVTHIITSSNKEGMCPRTIKYLMGVLQGKWIVSNECKCKYRQFLIYLTGMSLMK